MTAQFSDNAPDGHLQDKWDHFKEKAQLISPNNRKNFTILVVGTGLAGASAAASLAELGYQVKVFCIHDSPRRAHSIAAHGGINAAMAIAFGDFFTTLSKVEIFGLEK
jgi:succinate dehydrogenase / fumarate reductase flavoprotein subunit